MRNALSRYVAPGPHKLRLGLLAGVLTVMSGLGAAALAADPGSGGNSGATTTYRWVDAQGVVHYSDTPQPGAQKLEIAPAQTFQPSPASTAQTQAAPSAAGADAYTTCVITQPEAQQTLFAPDSVPVSVQLAPTLRPGDHVQVTYDGQMVAPTDDSGVNFQIDMPIRGQHTVAANVTDGSGRTLCTAPAVTFFVRRPSVLSPQSPTAQHPATPPLGR
jgi:hypothetical protein